MTSSIPVRPVRQSSPLLSKFQGSGESREGALESKGSVLSHSMNTAFCVNKPSRRTREGSSFYMAAPLTLTLSHLCRRIYVRQ
jgi:hypothetical protein